jgi:hypothetical protein
MTDLLSKKLVCCLDQLTCLGVVTSVPIIDERGPVAASQRGEAIWRPAGEDAILRISLAPGFERQLISCALANLPP